MAAVTVGASLRRARRLAWRRIGWILVPAVLVVLGTALFLAMTPPSYTASTVLHVGPLDAGGPLADAFAPRVLDPRTLATEAALVQSRELEEQVEARLGLTAEAEVEVEPDADLLVVTARSSTPAGAITAADEYARVYMERRVARAASASATEQARRDESISQLEAAIAALPPPPVGADQNLSAADLRRSSLLEERALLLAEAEGSSIDASLRGPNVEIVRAAAHGGATLSRSLLEILGASMLIGLAVGVALAVLRERLDDRLRSVDDLERLELGVPTIGVVPSDKRLLRRKALEAGDESPTSNVFRTLRGLLSNGAPREQGMLIDVAGVADGQGCSTVAAHLATAFARSGRSVVLVEAEDRGAPRSWATGDAASHPSPDPPLPVRQASPGSPAGPLALVATDQPRLELLAVPQTGNGNGAPMFTREVAALLEGVRASHDVVIVDSSSLIASTDALAWSQDADATILVARARRSTGTQLRRAVTLLGEVGAHVRGVVLNEGRVDELGYPKG